MKSLKNLMTENPTCVTPETTVREAAKLMQSQDVGSLPVVQDESSRRLVGMVTDRDLTIRVLAQGKDGNTAVRDAMSSDIQCCKVDDSLDDVEKIMSRHQVRRVPIVDENNRVVGMVAQADLALERKAVGEKDFGKVLEKISEPAGAR